MKEVNGSECVKRIRQWSISKSITFFFSHTTFTLLSTFHSDIIHQRHSEYNVWTKWQHSTQTNTKLVRHTSSKQHAQNHVRKCERNNECGSKKMPTKKENNAYKKWLEQMLEKGQRDTNLVIHIIRKKKSKMLNLMIRTGHCSLLSECRSQAIFFTWNWFDSLHHRNIKTPHAFPVHYTIAPEHIKIICGALWKCSTFLHFHF